MLEWKRGGLTQDILDKFAVIGGRREVDPVMGCIFDPKDTNVADWEDDEWYCVLPKIVVPKQPNRFGLKVGDNVTFETHDGVTRCCGFRGTHVVSGFDENGYRDGIARIVLEESSGKTFHPYWFGLCRSDGSPLPQKPATKTVVLEEWCSLIQGCYTFVWKVPGNHSTPIFFKTGVTRELEVPDVR